MVEQEHTPQDLFWLEAISIDVLEVMTRHSNMLGQPFGTHTDQQQNDRPSFTKQGLTMDNNSQSKQARRWGAADCLRVCRLNAGFAADTSDG
jgi:hypothetical protein